MYISWRFWVQLMSIYQMSIEATRSMWRILTGVLSTSSMTSELKSLILNSYREQTEFAYQTIHLGLGNWLVMITWQRLEYFFS